MNESEFCEALQAIDNDKNFGNYSEPFGKRVFNLLWKHFYTAEAIVQGKETPAGGTGVALSITNLGKRAAANPEAFSAELQSIAGMGVEAVFELIESQSPSTN